MAGLPGLRAGNAGGGGSGFRWEVVFQQLEDFIFRKPLPAWVFSAPRRLPPYSPSLEPVEIEMSKQGGADNHHHQHHFFVCAKSFLGAALGGHFTHHGHIYHLGFYENGDSLLCLLFRKAQSISHM
jgi:hypothetical protein